MVETGVIREFTTKISIGQLGAVAIHVFGQTESTSYDSMAEILGTNECTETVWFSGDFTIVHGILRDVSGLDSFVEHAKEGAQMRKVTVGIFGGVKTADVGQVYARTNREELTPLDYRIIGSLRKNSRKEIAVIAHELRISTGAVRRHLERLMEDGSIEMNIVFYPGSSSGVTNVLGIILREGSSRNTLMKELEDAFGSRFIAFIRYLNIPNMMLAFVWTDKVAEMLQIEGHLKVHPAVESVWTYTLQRKYLFETWRDKLLNKKIGDVRTADGS